MKAIKKLCAAAFAILGIVSISSCEDKDQEKEPEQTGLVNESGDLDEVLLLSSITADTTNVKKQFYLGDEFTTEGLVVTANYVRYEEGTPVPVPVVVDNYFVDSSDVDMNTCGTYPVTITFRQERKIVTATYDITVVSSALVEANIKYAGGLEVLYDGEAKLELLLGATYTFQGNKVKAKIHYLQAGKEVDQPVAVPYTYLEIDSSSVNTSKVGTYMVKYKYTEVLSLNGQNYKNIVTSYTLVNVTNPVTKIEKISGQTTFAASTKELDLTQWQIAITRKNPIGNETVNFSYDLFKAAKCSSFDVGVTKLEVSLIENPSAYFEVDITITESTTEDIYITTDLKTVAAGYNQGGCTFAFEGLEAGDNYDDRADKDKYAGITFGRRVKMKGAGKKILLSVEKPTNFLLFAANANGGAPIAVTLYDSESNELQELWTNEVKQGIVALEYSLPTAGSYYIMVEETVYFHGFVFATEK